MLAAGWHAHTLNASGKFLVSAAEHDTPKRARAYLATGQAVANTTATYADTPQLDPISRRALVQDPSSGDVYSDGTSPSPTCIKIGESRRPTDAHLAAFLASLAGAAAA